VAIGILNFRRGGLNMPFWFSFDFLEDEFGPDDEFEPGVEDEV
jgi:hypothetical protein